MSCLTDKVAIVTGSSRGLGRACARELADHGGKVVLNYYTNQESADELLAEMTGKGQEAIVVQAGVAHPDECNRLIEETVKRFGGLDILVNNAGVNRDRTIRRMSVDEWNEVIATDLSSIFHHEPPGGERARPGGVQPCLPGLAGKLAGGPPGAGFEVFYAAL